jgi:hypothetical protein
MMVMAVAMMGRIIMVVVIVAMAAAAMPVLILRVHAVRSFQDPTNPYIPHWGMFVQARQHCKARQREPDHED